MEPRKSFASVTLGEELFNFSHVLCGNFYDYVKFI